MGQPEHTELIVTPAIRRAMITINDQKVFRAHGPNGSVWKCERDGVSPRTLWKLFANGLIEDEPQTTVRTTFHTAVRMRLSKVGLDVLKASLVRKAWR